MPPTADSSFGPNADPGAPRSEEREREVRDVFYGLGFSRVGFARARALPASRRLHSWLERGYAGTMEYLARHATRRTDPRKVLPGAKTVIVAALDYPRSVPAGLSVPDTDRGEISAYARGRDYHRVMEPRLRAATKQLASTFPARYRWYVDTGPVLEKAWAHEAGVAWIGKNTCAIHRESGSFHFLGVVLTTLDLRPDRAASDHCGACRLCIDACPSLALVEPYVLDARRCISYLTIEHRGAIEPELEERMGNLIFGCDICQEVCPWNNEPASETVPELAPHPENVFPPLTELASLGTSNTFRERFRGSAVLRARYEGFLRNVLIALGNSERPELLPVLQELAARIDVRNAPVLRETAARAIERLGRSAT